MYFNVLTALFLSFVVSCSGFSCLKCTSVEKKVICSKYDTEKCVNGLQPVPCGCGCMKCASKKDEPCGGYMKSAGKCGIGLFCEMDKHKDLQFPIGRCVRELISGVEQKKLIAGLFDILSALRASGASDMEDGGEDETGLEHLSEFEGIPEMEVYGKDKKNHKSKSRKRTHEAEIETNEIVSSPHKKEE